MAKKISDVIFSCILGAIIIFFGVAIFLLPQKSFSEKENRNLATMPSLSLDSLTSGEYFKRLGDFYSDQFPLRNCFTAAHAICELSAGKQESNRVVLSNGGALVARTEENINKILSNLDAISTIENALLYVPPRARDILGLPYQSTEAPSMLTGDTAENFHSLCSQAEEYIYYRTDHHWTTLGAYIAYTQICNRLSISPYSEDFFIKETASTDFRGTAFSRSCLPKAMIEPDTITLYRYDGDQDITVINRESDQEYTGFYRSEHLDTADKYRVFLGGNYAHLTVLNDTPKPKLLLVKDSFANSIIPFLALHFDIEVIDPRYCSKSLLQEQLAREDIDNILFLLSFDTLGYDIFK